MTYQSDVEATKAAGGPAAGPSVPVTTQSNVATPTAEHDRLMKLWKLPRALMQGTRGMRSAGSRATGNAQYTDWLPREPAETPAAYTVRLNRSTLFNAFRKTVKDMTGKVFQREVTLEKDVPDDIKTWCENIDLAGRHLNVFARDAFYDGMQTGINYILVDMPPALKKDDGSPVTIADEQKAARRPYLCLVKGEDLIGFKSELIDGVITLTQARIREIATVADGDFAETAVEQIRVLTRGAWAIWQKTKDASGKEDWAEIDSGITSLKDIPLVPVYINRTGFMIGEPPLEDLADLNVAHWQSSSDQRNILHVARVPILFGAGFGPDTKLELGPNSAVFTTDPTATLAWVEHTGAAIDSGQADLDKLEMQMQVQGLQLLVAQPGGKTATGEIRDEAKENSPLAMMAMALGDALECALGFMAQFGSVEMPAAKAGDAGGSVDVNTDFGVGSGNSVDLTVLLQAVTAGKLSKETFWSELKRRDILADSFDADVEKDRIGSEAPELDAGLGKGMDLNGPPKPKPPVNDQPKA